MKAFLAVTCFAVLSTAVFSKDWTEILLDDLRAPLVQPPKVETRKEKDEVIVRVTNVSKEPLRYFGSSSDHPQKFWEEFKAGKWVAAGWDFCGLGLTTFLIRPEETVEFRFMKLFFEKDRRLLTVFSSGDWKHGSIILLYQEN